MSVSESATVPLLAVALKLRAAGLAISVGDLLSGLDALARLEAPFLTLDPIMRNPSSESRVRLRKADRTRLVWLVQTLWARSDEECEIVQRVVEGAIAPVPSDRTLALAQHLGFVQAENDDSGPKRPGPRPTIPLEDLIAKADADADAKTPTDEPDDCNPAGQAEPTPLGGPGASARGGRARAAPLRVPVPIIRDATLVRDPTVSLEDKPAVDELALAAIWRRFRQPHLVADPRRIDDEATVRATIAAGGDLRIVQATRRVNRARLAAFIDTGTAMAPWRTWMRLLRETLEPTASRLEEAHVIDFAGIPDAATLHPKSTSDGKHVKLSGLPLLIFGEAGAARPAPLDAGRRLDAFIAAAAKRNLSPIVWINPMPQTRWPDWFRARIGVVPNTTAHELTREELMRAIDRLRKGAR